MLCDDFTLNHVILCKDAGSGNRRLHDNLLFLIKPPWSQKKPFRNVTSTNLMLKSQMKGREVHPKLFVFKSHDLQPLLCGKGKS